MHPGDFSLSTEARDGTLDVRLGGELDMNAAFRFESSVDALVGEGEVRAVALDLSGLTFIDSAGIGALLSTRERLGERDIGLSVTRVSEEVRRILDVTGVSGSLAGPGTPLG